VIAIVRVLAFALLVAAVVVPTAVADVAPRGLVLSRSDVPRGYTTDETQLLGNPGSGATESFRELAKQSGRVTGYYVDYTNGSKQITSVAELFRRPAGAQIYFKWYTDKLSREGEGARSRIAIGDGGFVYRVRSTKNSTFVLWRDGRVVSSVLCQAMPAHRTLAATLAGKQDRRATAALELPPTR
jgi:hypothetical protein